MASPSPFGLLVMIGLQPTRELLSPLVLPFKEYDINYNDFPYNKFIKNNFDFSTIEVSVSEHVAFLAFWLSAFFFYTNSLQVCKVFAPLASLIHERVFLSQQFLLTFMIW